MKKGSYTFIILLCVTLFSCNKQAPQLPSNKVVVDNSKANTMLAINQDLAAKEDSLLNILVKKKYNSFSKSDMGCWYKIDQPGKGKKINDKSVCSFSYKLILTNGKVVESGKNQVTIGKNQIVNGLEESLKLLHEGDSATIIIPWYMAYGMKGKEPKIPPYTSIIYQIKISE